MDRPIKKTFPELDYVVSARINGKDVDRFVSFSVRRARNRRVVMLYGTVSKNSLHLTTDHAVDGVGDFTDVDRREDIAKLLLRVWEWADQLLRSQPVEA